jgi:hypothetical protein
VPITDPERKREVTKAWREKKMKEGYGKALWRRRAHIYKNEETLRMGLENVLHSAREASETPTWIIQRLERLLESAPAVGKPADYME